ncbi:uncharacterized protein LOC124412762 [Diprion similis]|uniref:uncharacterized protein LOC124412762 n=1 Tax=Diprion similis TaxID=362088 RepID=UPI001EF87609|nr:uncharacterized protein LOC124412762 [Diprion similis]
MDEIPGTQSSESNETYDRETILLNLATDEHLRTYILKQENPEISMTRRTSRPTENECRETVTEELRKVLIAVPDTMLHLLTGWTKPADCGRPADQKPDWLDMEKLRRGQKFAQDHSFSIYIAEILSWFATYTFQSSLNPVIITGKTSSPFAAFKRFLSTSLRIRHWCTQDLWSKETAAWKDILAVRRMHAVVKRRMDTFTKEDRDAAAKIPKPFFISRKILLEDFPEACKTPAIGQCPLLIDQNSPDPPRSFNQTDMAITQWGFVGLIVSYPEAFGVHYATDEDLEAYCHLWRSISYQLGMEDDFNFCRGTLKDIRKRSNDFIEAWVKPHLREVTPEWEHMLRCIFSSLNLFMPNITFETGLLQFTDIINLKMPRLYSSLSYKQWIGYYVTKYFFYYATKLPGVIKLANTFLNRSLDDCQRMSPQEMEAIRIKLEK